MEKEQVKRNTFKIRYTFYLLLLLISALEGCKKDDYETLTKEQKLILSKWRVADVQVGFRQSVVSECDLDNILTFNPDNTVELDRGVHSCDTTDQRIVAGTWALTNNNSSLTFLGNSYDLEVLQKDDLRVMLRNYVTAFNDTLDVYFLFKALPR